MSLRPLFTAAPLAALFACQGAPAPLPAPVVVALPSATVDVPPPPAPTTAPAPSAAPTVEPAPEGDRHRVAVVLRPGDPPCTLAFDGGLFNEDADSFVVASVSRIATEAGGACAASVLYDLAHEKKASPGDPDPDPLQAGPFLKPSRPRPADYDASEWNLLADLNFDGYADLCAVSMTGAYNYSQLCWLFDPQKRVFVREEALDELIFMTRDPGKKTLSAGHRVGGPAYFKGEYAWRNNKLVTTLEEEINLMERPDGRPVPKGFARWVVRRTLRNGKLVKVFDGAEKDKP